MLTRRDICAYAQENYQTLPDNPWSKHPHYTVLRHSRSRKWYGLLMNIPCSKIGMEGENTVDILNLKTDRAMQTMLRNSKGISPAYHMNKEHWISIVLDGSVSDDEIYFLIDTSFRLTL